MYINTRCSNWGVELTLSNSLCSPHSAITYASPNGSVVTAAVGHVCRTCSAYLPLSFPRNASMPLKSFHPLLTVFSHSVTFYLSLSFPNSLFTSAGTNANEICKCKQGRPTSSCVFSFSSTRQLELGMWVSLWLYHRNGSKCTWLCKLGDELKVGVSSQNYNNKNNSCNNWKK